MFLIWPLLFYFSPIDPVGLGTSTCLVKHSSSHVGRIRLVPCCIGISGINPSRSVTDLPSGDDVVHARLVLGDQLSSVIPHDVLLPLGVVQDPGELVLHKLPLGVHVDCLHAG